MLAHTYLKHLPTPLFTITIKRILMKSQGYLSEELYSPSLRLEGGPVTLCLATIKITLKPLCAKKLSQYIVPYKVINSCHIFSASSKKSNFDTDHTPYTRCLCGVISVKIKFLVLGYTFGNRMHILCDRGS